MNLLYAAHVLTAVLFLGPVMLATSTFHVRAFAAHEGDTRQLGAASLLFRITKIYGLLSLLVPVIGVAAWIFAYPDLMKNGVYHASILLCVIAWALLFFLIIPRQRQMIQALGVAEDEDAEITTAPIADWNKAKSQLSMFGGIFNLLWVIVAILMLVA